MVRDKKKQDGPAAQDDLVFKALAGADRRKILDLLRDAPMTTGELGKRLSWLDSHGDVPERLQHVPGTGRNDYFGVDTSGLCVRKRYRKSREKEQWENENSYPGEHL